MAAETVILDGGMGRELQRRGAPFRQPEWSALALSEAPQAVEAVHAAYIDSGANVITLQPVPALITRSRVSWPRRRCWTVLSWRRALSRTSAWMYRPPWAR